MTARSAWVGVAILAFAACDDDRGADAPRVSEPPTRRVIDPPRRDVRALPPHAIAASGVGPYKLGVGMERILSALPSGPRLTVLQIPGVLDVRIGRDDGLLVGGERQGPASFVAVLREGLARTADGIGVGASRDAVVTALGPVDERPLVARDPALWVGRHLPGAHFLFTGDRVEAVLLATPAASARDDVVARCALVDGGASYEGAVPAAARVQPACLGAANGYFAVGEQVVMVAASEAEHPARRIASVQVPGLRWVAPVRGEGERDDLIVVAEQLRDRARVVTVVALRPDGNRLAQVASVEAYRLTDAGLALIGAKPSDVALRIEVVAEGDLLEIGGVFVHRVGGAAQVVAPLVPVTVRRARRTDERTEGRGDPGATAPSGAGLDAGRVDAGRVDAQGRDRGPDRPRDGGIGPDGRPP